MKLEIMRDILGEVVTERNKQDARWGEQNHKPIEWCAILGEEVGEVNKAALQAHFDSANQGDEYTTAQLEEYRAELVQVAAVAVAMIQSLDRNELNKLNA